MFYCIKSFYAPLKRFLDVFYWFIMLVFFTCTRIRARENKKRDRKKLQRALFSLDQFLFPKKRELIAPPLRTV